MPEDHEDEVGPEDSFRRISLLPDPAALTRDENIDSYTGPDIPIPPLGSYAKLIITHGNDDEMFSPDDPGVALTTEGLLTENSANDLHREGRHELTIRFIGAREQLQPIFVKMKLPGSNLVLSSQLTFDEDKEETGTAQGVPKRYRADTDKWQIPGIDEPCFVFAEPDNPQLLSQLSFSFGNQPT